MDSQNHSGEQENRCEHCGALITSTETETSEEAIIHQYLLDYYK
ncbi:MAG: hypothetical protein WB502_13510 [Thermoactinomyces sp.]